jgi:probable HAF family extracellular repeat protein
MISKMCTGGFGCDDQLGTPLWRTVSWAALFGGAVVLLAPSSAAAKTCITSPVDGQVGTEMCGLEIFQEFQRTSQPLTIDYSAKGVSADGGVVIGSGNNATRRIAFRWTRQNGLEELVGFGGNTEANDVNWDGSVAIGVSGAPGGLQRAVRWEKKPTGTEINYITALAIGPSVSYGVNAAGNVVVGSTNSRAFRWVAGPGGGIQYLDPLSGDVTSIAYAVNADPDDASLDGTVVVGASVTLQIPAPKLNAVRWVAGGNTEKLGSLTPGGDSTAFGVNKNGSVIVGSAQNAVNIQRAFRWVAGPGGGVTGSIITDLGTLVGGTSSQAKDVNAAGDIVVGVSSSSAGNRAFRWVADGTGSSGGTMQNLGTLTGGTESAAFGVNADGSIVVGSSSIGSGNKRAFIWRNQIQDFEALLISFPLAADDMASAAQQQQDRTFFALQQTCLAEDGRNCMMSTLLLNSDGSTDNVGSGSQTSADAMLTYGRGLSDTTTLGFTLGLGTSDLRNNGFDMDVTVMAAIWMRYSETGSNRRGWQGEVALGWSSATGEINRGRGLTDVPVSYGDAGLDTQIAHASLGYGFMTPTGWLLTPAVGLTQFRTTRGTYAETGKGFNASYDRLTLERTTVSFELQTERDLNDASRLLLGVGITHDLYAEPVTLTGTSDVPGMTTLGVNGTLSKNATRAFLSAGYTYDLSDDRMFSTALALAQPDFGDRLEARVNMNFSIQF